MKKIITLFFPLLVVVFLLGKAFLVLDPDYGWHFQMGTHILSLGIPKTDPFSFSMENYPFVDHEWLMDCVFFLIHTWVGYGLLVFMMVVFVYVALWFQIKKKWGFYILALLFLPFAGVRPQILSWVFFSLFLSILKKGKNLWVLPLIMVLWVNLHGSFFLGLVLVGLFTGVAFIEKKPISKKSVVLIATIGAMWINPYGISVWREILMTLTDARLHWTVVEWYPAFLYLHIGFWIYAIFSLSLFIRYIRKTAFIDRVCYLLFFIAALSSVRNIPFWLLVSIPLLMEGLGNLVKEVRKTPYAKQKLQFITKMGILLLVSVVFCQMVIDGGNIISSTREKMYPEKAVSYINKHNIQGNIFTVYGWGGYVLWKSPQTKTFVDGRMPSWRWNSPDKKYSDYAFDEYQKVLEGKIPFKTVQKKYNIQYVLYWTPQEKTKQTVAQKYLQSILNPFDMFKKNKYNAFPNLKPIYKDSLATLYVAD